MSARRLAQTLLPQLTRGFRSSARTQAGGGKDLTHHEICYGDGHKGLRPGYNYVSASRSAGADTHVPEQWPHLESILQAEGPSTLAFGYALQDWEHGPHYLAPWTVSLVTTPGDHYSTLRVQPAGAAPALARASASFLRAPVARAAVGQAHQVACACRVSPQRNVPVAPSLLTSRSVRRLFKAGARGADSAMVS